MDPLDASSFYTQLFRLAPKPIQLKKTRIECLKKMEALINERIHFIKPQESPQLNKLKRKLIKSKIRLSRKLIIKIEEILNNFINLFNFHEFPKEILSEIFKFVDIKELTSILFVSKKFNEIANNFLVNKKQLNDNWSVTPLQQIILTLPFFGYSMTALNFSNLELNDFDLSRAIKSCPLITEIYLEQCKQLTNQGLVSLKELRFLRFFTLNKCFKCTSKIFENLSHLSELQELALINEEQNKIEISQERFHLFFYSLPKLEVLRLFPIEHKDFFFIKLINPIIKVW